MNDDYDEIIQRAPALKRTGILPRANMIHWLIDDYNAIGDSSSFPQ